MTSTLAKVMAPVHHVPLDFDGPVCSVFGELPAPVVARRLAEVIDADLHDEIIGSDPSPCSLLLPRGGGTPLSPPRSS